MSWEIEPRLSIIIDTMCSEVKNETTSTQAHGHSSSLQAKSVKQIEGEERRLYDLSLIQWWKIVLVLITIMEISLCVSSYLLENKAKAAAEEEEAKQKKVVEMLMFWKKNKKFILDVAEMCTEGIKCSITNKLVWLQERKYSIEFFFNLAWIWEGVLASIRTRSEYLKKKRNTFTLEAPDVVKSNDGSGIIFFITVAKPFFFNILLLPIGFFLLNWRDVKSLSLFQEYSFSNTVSRSETLSEETEYCIFYGAFVHFSRMLRVSASDMAWKTRKKASKNVFHFAFYHPLEFSHKLRIILNVVRWAKYFVPIIALVGKLKSNFEELMKKRNQEKEAAKALKIRNKMWKKLSPEETELKAVLKLQAKYRARHEKKKVERMKRVLRHKEEKIVLIIQKNFRLRTERKRLIEEAKANKVESLLNKNRIHKSLSIIDQMQVIKLRKELESTSERKQSVPLLLRPNTKFSVTWKALFVFCIIIELIQLSLKPYLEEMFDEVSSQPPNLTSLLQKRLLPISISEYEGCMPFANNDNCDGICPSLEYMHIVTIHYLIQFIFFIIGMITFLDVPVTFFTGEINEKNGLLIPKPFFNRWILPGLLLQLLVNPKMKEVSSITVYFIKLTHQFGPDKVLRWNIILLPFLASIASRP